MICVADFCDLCLRQSLRTLSPILSPTFPVHCNGLNSITATQTGLSWTCHGLCRKHLDMSRWFVSTTFVICVGNFHWNFMVSWFVAVCIRNFHDLYPRLSPRGSFSESRRNGIWALLSYMSVNRYITSHAVQRAFFHWARWMEYQHAWLGLRWGRVSHVGWVAVV